MTEAEALELRKNGAKLYNHVRVAFYTAIEQSLINLGDYLSHSQRADARQAIHDAIDSAWDATNLDDTFHTLSSQGYRSLIQAGWNPYVANDPNNWQPSPDCIDHPTTRGGISDTESVRPSPPADARNCDITPYELRKTSPAIPVGGYRND